MRKEHHYNKPLLPPNDSEFRCAKDLGIQKITNIKLASGIISISPVIGETQRGEK